MVQALAAVHVLVSVPLAWFASLYLLARYRKAIDSSMRESSSGEPGDAAEPEVSSAAADAGPDLEVITAAGSAAARLSDTSRALRSRAVTGAWRTARAYALAGAVHALVMAALVLAWTDSVFSLQRYLVLALVLAWPVIPCVVHVAVADRRWKVIGPVAGTLAVFLVSGLTFQEMLILWAIVMGVPTAMVLLLGHRAVRPVAPVVLVAVVLSVTAAVFALDLAGLFLSSVTGAYASLAVAALLLLGVSAVLAWWFVRWYARRYTDRNESDQVLLLDTWWLLFTVWECVFLATFAGFWGLTGLLAFVCYRAVLSAKLGVPAAGAGVPLLLLRVFGHRKRSERLLEEVGRAWRHIGPIRLVAGTDLATQALEPHELYEYLGGRLARHVVRQDADIPDIGQLHAPPCWDGRYRIHDFIATADAWRAVFRRLAAHSDAVLMDLRGFSEQRRGAMYELQHLIEWVPLKRVVVLIDESTDVEALRQTIRGHASPRTRNADAVLRALRTGSGSSAEVSALLALLCDAAADNRDEGG